jgi:alpha-tubulin suppressor-like RCC1 family protein
MEHIRRVFYCLCVSLLAACGGGGGSSAPPIVVNVTPPVASVMVGEQIQLAATTNSTGPVMWSSSNTAVATVNASGLVIALILGQVTITATSGGQTGTAVLTTTTGIVFASVSAGDSHTCGVTPPDGVAYCWGDNSSGQLGNGTTTNSATPVPVSGGLSFASLSAGGNQTCGVASFRLPQQIGGAVYCWGNNSSGQLGNGTTTNSAAPTLVAGGLLFASVSVGGKHVCGESVTFDNGGTHCWGDNSFGQLGIGTLINSAIPVIPLFNSGFDEGGVSAGSNHTCSVVDVGPGFLVIITHACWGDNSSGQLGNGTTTNSAVPVIANYTGNNPARISAGTLYSCTTGEPASCWGNNGVGQLGNGTTTNSETGVSVSGGFNFASVSSGGDHTCAVTSFGVPEAPLVGGIGYCWGGNASGQLGNGTMITSTTPVAVTGGLIFATVSAGGHHSCGVVIASGAVYCWGDNTSGQLGNSWTTSSSVPVNVAGPP